MVSLGIVVALSSCTNISPTAYKRTPPMNLKFLNCSQDSDAEGCDGDQKIVEKTKKSLSKYQNSNMNIFDNFFANGNMAKPAVKSEPASQASTSTKSPGAKEPKRLGIENENTIEHKLSSSTHSKLNGESPASSGLNEPSNEMSTKPVVPLPQRSADEQARPKNNSAPVTMDSKPSPATSAPLPVLKAPSSSIKKGTIANNNIAAPTMTPPVASPAVVAAPTMTPPAASPAAVAAPTMTPPAASPVVPAPTVPVPAAIPNKATSSSGEPPVPALKDNSSTTEFSYKNTKPAAANSDKQIPSVPAIKSSDLSRKALIPSQNYVRPKDIATGAVAFFYEEQAEDEPENKNSNKKINDKKMQLVSIAPSNEQVVLSEEKGTERKQNNWKEKLVSAKTKLTGYFDGVKDKMKNLFHSKE